MGGMAISHNQTLLFRDLVMSRQNIKESRRLQLIEANMACIARHGLTDTTIAHVSKEADMSRGICNFYFESKEKMMQETLRHIAEEYRLWLEGAGSTLEALVAGHFSQKLCNAKRLAVWMAFVAHAASHAPYRKILLASHEQTVSALAAAGTEQAVEIAALIKGLWMQFLLAPEAGSREVLAQRCLAFAHNKVTPLKIVAKTVKPARPETEEMPLFDLFAKKA
jgi:TetR/AcrR family transcriptional repressor of bet genes